MKKKLLTIAALLLVCVLSAGMASAEHGYTRVSDIPMAVDFTYSVEFAEDGTPYVQTDYPFEETGAMQMILIYCKEDRPTTLQILYAVCNRIHEQCAGITTTNSKREVAC